MFNYDPSPRVAMSKGGSSTVTKDNNLFKTKASVNSSNVAKHSSAMSYAFPEVLSDQ